MQVPLPLLESLSAARGFDREAFEAVHAAGESITSIRLNPLKPLPSFGDRSWHELERVPWCGRGYYLPQRPSFTFDPFFHAGCYYVQEASSMFLEHALRASGLPETPLRVLDLCAAPGGKSTHLQSILPTGSLLVSNEVIRSRVSVLRDNMVKWGGDNVLVTHNDPADLSAVEAYFDVVVVDAPCSGSGLFRRDPEAVGEWSPQHVQLCSARQQRILADCWPALKEGGLLIYSTCSYSLEEDEGILRWLQQEMGAVPVPLSVPGSWHIVGAEGGFRFWPDKLKGEGFFLACLQKPGEWQEGCHAVQAKGKQERKDITLNKQETAGVLSWLKEDAGYALQRFASTVYAWPRSLVPDFHYLAGRLRVIHSGVELGEWMRDKLVPAHALAMSRLVRGDVPRVPLNREEAIRYLQRKDFSLENTRKGWALATYEGQELGWLNILTGRFNNYYPRELRILRDEP